MRSIFTLIKETFSSDLSENPEIVKKTADELCPSLRREIYLHSECMNGEPKCKKPVDFSNL